MRAAVALLAFIAAGALAAADVPPDTAFCTSDNPFNRRTVGLIGLRWTKTVLTVGFLDGDDATIRRVERLAREWTAYAGLRFDFTSDARAAAAADIRVSFQASGRRDSWSAVGTSSLDRRRYPRESMSLAALNGSLVEPSFRRIVLHEFGHALGLVHEHMNPTAGLQWDLSRVYAWYAATAKWSPREVDENVLERYSVGSTNYSAFDRDSIMVYPIPASLTVNGFHTGYNTVLSRTDKIGIAAFYPRRR